MNKELKRALAPLSGDEMLDEIEEMMAGAYYEQWKLSDDVQERETIHLKLQVVRDMLVEFSSMIR